MVSLIRVGEFISCGFLDIFFSLLSFPPVAFFLGFGKLG